PQVMIVDSFHHSVSSPASVGMRSFETTNVMTTDTIDVSHTRLVSGASKFIRSTLAYRLVAKASLIQYETTEATIIMMRMTKIQTRSCTWTVSLRTASRMKLISATPVTP